MLRLYHPADMALNGHASPYCEQRQLVLSHGLQWVPKLTRVDFKGLSS